MSAVKITLYPVDFETPFSLSDCVMSIAILAEATGLGYELNSSGAEINGDKPDLLRFLNRLKDETFGMLADKIVMVVSYPEEMRPSRTKTGTCYHEDRPAGSSRSLEETVLDMIG
jgi:uncharacterized protein YqgV (UPF0045/DUF77 family)